MRKATNLLIYSPTEMSTTFGAEFSIFKQILLQIASSVGLITEKMQTRT